ncbi:MAG: hypothetical protein CL678_18855 [Bdellovibrionaceae bacterium]|nr:hypothetical protein [Pseudobdellovibrionaceae bacterium]|tara:strand:+ start:7741 stop:8805 length:1065 start_codon:yes stop_codon:yes gene_type:complete
MILFRTYLFLKQKFQRVLFFSLFLSISVFAQSTVEINDFKKKFCDDGFCVWVRKSDKEIASNLLTKEVLKAYSIATSYWYFKEFLPKKVHILFDSEWKKSAGFFSKDLIIDGSPAILLQPHRLKHQLYFYGLFIHEFTHVVYSELLPQTPRWVGEGVASLLETIILRKYFDRKEINPNALPLEKSFQYQNLSMIDLPSIHSIDFQFGEREKAQYGLLYSYFYYLYENCGREHWIYRLIGPDQLVFKTLSSKDPITASFFLSELDQIPRNKEVCHTFKSSFYYFQYARYAYDLSSRSGYIEIQQPSIEPTDCPLSLLSFSGNAYRLNTGKKCSVQKCLDGDIQLDSTACIQVRTQ